MTDDRGSVWDYRVLNAPCLFPDVVLQFELKIGRIRKLLSVIRIYLYNE